ncbi:ATP-binding protein [Streptomyces sp. NPDC021093]|uniref:ATP-binding protein n=1 Tax=Streptomyces sp. NPDC021093 TaxID=3365112 RepID=UPI0037BCFE88
MTRQKPGRAGPVSYGRSVSEDVRKLSEGARAVQQGDIRATEAAERLDRARGALDLRWRLGRSDLTAVAEVRRALRELLRNWGRPDCADVAELLTSELVTNALIHTESDAELHATLAESKLRVEVYDHLSRLPEPRLAACDENTNGRGLLLVQTLADAWGVRMHGHGPGKVVWFELDGGPAGA